MVLGHLDGRQHDICGYFDAIALHFDVVCLCQHTEFGFPPITAQARLKEDKTHRGGSVPQTL